MDQLRDLALAERPKLIVAGATAYPRLIQPEPLREIADESGALLMFDAAHIAGLIAGGVHPNPTQFADIVTFTTHKTLRGPRGGAIICRSDYAKAVDKAMFPGIQGGPLDHAVAAKAVAFAEAATAEFADYAARIVENSQALAAALAGHGFRLVSGGTDNHLMLVDLRTFDPDLTGKEAQATLDAAGISLNKNTVPDDPRSPFVTSGVRIGTPRGDHPGDGHRRHGHHRRPHLQGVAQPHRRRRGGCGASRRRGAVRSQSALPGVGHRGLVGPPEAERQMARVPDERATD